jgi:hypothetical protein
MKYVVFIGTMNFFSSVTQWGKKFKSDVDAVKDAPHATSQKWLKK